MQLQNVEHPAEIEPVERSKSVKQSAAKIGGKSEVKTVGGSEWESNPPTWSGLPPYYETGALEMPRNGRQVHQICQI